MLWHHFSTFFLRENVRQQSDKPYLCLLNRARVGLLNPQDVAFLKACLVDKKSTLANLHLFATRAAVAEHNSQCQTTLPSDVHTQSIFVSQQDQQPGIPYLFPLFFLSIPCPDYFIPNDDKDAG